MWRSSSARCAASTDGSNNAIASTLARNVRTVRTVRTLREQRSHRRGVLRSWVVSFILIMSSSDPKSLDRLAARLDANHLRRNEPLGPYTTFRIGGPADLFFEATSADALA